HGTEAADIVFTSGADIVVVGLNITTQVCFIGFEDLLELKESKGMHARFLSDMFKFYRDIFAECEGIHVHPKHFTFKKGVVEFRESMVRLYKPISVAWMVDVQKVLGYVKQHYVTIMMMFVVSMYKKLMNFHVKRKM
ncbi:hypothetical protein EJB05_45480, partial [Eragrostis curvula]